VKVFVEGKIEGHESHSFRCGRCKAWWSIPFEEMDVKIDREYGTSYITSNCPTCDKYHIATYSEWNPALQVAYEKQQKERAANMLPWRYMVLGGFLTVALFFLAFWSIDKYLLG
jgi:hypothetical protein